MTAMADQQHPPPSPTGSRPLEGRRGRKAGGGGEGKPDAVAVLGVAYHYRRAGGGTLDAVAARAGLARRAPRGDADFDAVAAGAGVARRAPRGDADLDALSRRTGVAGLTPHHSISSLTLRRSSRDSRGDSAAARIRLILVVKAITSSGLSTSMPPPSQSA